MSHEEALEFMGVTQDTDSDSIEAIAMLIASEENDAKAQLAQALRVISKYRGNDLLLQRAAERMELVKKEDDAPAVQGHSQGLSMFLAQLAGAHESANQVSVTSK